MIDKVCEDYKIDKDDLDTKTRKYPIPIVKGIIYNWLRRIGHKQTVIGRHFGVRNHSTIISSMRTAREQEIEYIDANFLDFHKEMSDRFVRKVIESDVFKDKFLYEAMGIDRSTLHRKKSEGYKFKIQEAIKLKEAMEKRKKDISKLIDNIK